MHSTFLNLSSLQASNQIYFSKPCSALEKFRYNWVPVHPICVGMLKETD